MIRLLLAAAVLAAEPVPDDQPLDDPLAAEDARIRGVLLELNHTRIDHFERGMAIVGQTERQCTQPWADDMVAVGASWYERSAALKLRLQQHDGKWVLPPREAVLIAAAAEMDEEIDAAETLFVERARSINQLMTRCPEHREALQGIYALGKSGFIVG